MSAIAGLAFLLRRNILSELIIARTICAQIVFDDDFISIFWCFW